MAKLFPLAVGLLAFFGFVSQANAAKQCMGCVVFGSLIERNAILRDNDVQRTISALCNSIFDPSYMGFFNEMCSNLLNPMVAPVQQALDNGLSPDQFCQDVMNMCDGTCVLYDKWPSVQDRELYNTNALNRDLQASNNPKAKALAISQDYQSFMSFFFDRLAVFLRFSKDEISTNEDRELYETAKIAAEKLGYSDLYNYVGSLTGLKDGFSQSMYDSARKNLHSVLLKMNPEYKVSSSKHTKTYADYLKEIEHGHISSEVDTCDNLTKSGLHYPFPDQDQDHFGSSNLYRGIDWRGKDCNDNDPTVYPGRKITDLPTTIDHNCNGIFGTDSTGIAYENQFCSHVPQYGVIAVGDSATAHFAVPARWFGTSDDHGWDDLLGTVLHEADFPQCSTYTGFNSKACADSFDDSSVTLKSIYERVLERNLCVFRDYQNMGVNGNSIVRATPNSGSATVTYINRGKFDHPALVFISLIGNDICSKSPEISSMTSMNEYRNALVETLEYIDSVVPSGSHVFIGGLVDGRLLYDALSDQLHPFGVHFSKLYDFLNCLESSPCAGWLNSNKDIRERSSNHALSLSNMAQHVASTTSYSNFDVHYYDNAAFINEIFNTYKASGKDTSKLIEPFDGFHPSGITQALLAEKVWEFVTSKVNIPINPFNKVIQQVFGDQGGYY